MTPRSRSLHDFERYRRRAVRPGIEISRKTFLILTEGEKTEPNYFDELRRRFHLRTVDVKIVHPKGTDPITLLNRAIEMRDTQLKLSRKSNRYAPYDEVWVLFDLEKIHDARRAIARQAEQRRKHSEIKFAISDPSFEFWLLIHYQRTMAPFVSSDDVIRKLKHFWSGYKKGDRPSASLLKLIPVAVANAEFCREQHKTSGGAGNPSTDVDLLIRSLNAAVREKFRFALDGAKEN
ncbi:MAG: RloB family protein [Candidatus Sumerlaeota bacterium]|nr:RloB family protein [Candidatus Sumerlaeota bacterium]